MMERRHPMNVAAIMGMGGGAQDKLVAHPAHSAKRIQIVRQAKLYRWRTNPVALAPVGLLAAQLTRAAPGSSGFQRFFPDPYEVPREIAYEIEQADDQA